MTLKVFIDFNFLKKFTKKVFDTHIKGDNLTTENEILLNILNKYPEKSVILVDFKNEEFDELKNPLFEKILDYGSVERENEIETFVNNADYPCALFFMSEEKKWFYLAVNKGALCFSWDNYEHKIKKITTHCHFRVDLGACDFAGWDKLFENIKELPTTQLIMTDKYIINKTPKKTYDLFSENIIPIFKQFITKKKILEAILFSDLSSNDKNFTMNILQKSENIVKENIEFDKINLKIVSFPKGYHDRILYGQYFMVDATHGFNKELFKRHTNIQIIVDTIFSEYTYKRMLRHKKEIESHCQKLVNNTFKIELYPDEIEKRNFTIK